jgi:DNA repair exonuclease SbcCD ATPase subunit
LDGLHLAVEKVLHPRLAEPLAHLGRVTTEAQTAMRQAVDSYHAALVKVRTDHEVALHSIQQKEVAARAALEQSAAALEGIRQQHAQLAELVGQQLQAQINTAATEAGKAQAAAFAAGIVDAMQDRLEQIYAELKEVRQSEVNAAGAAISDIKTTLAALSADVRKATDQAHSATFALRAASSKLHWKHYILTGCGLFGIATGLSVALWMVTHWPHP